MFLRSVLLCCLHALALAGPLTKPSADSSVKLERGSCPLFWFSFGTDCYHYVASQLSWAEAELNCLSLDANLVSIHSSNEMSFIATLIKSFDPTIGNHWIGFSDVHKEGSWMWSDGSPRDFAFWESFQPDNANGGENCAHIRFLNGISGNWNDRECTNVCSSVCKAC